ncbi:MAG TPA: aldehyde dehydrogenase family protein [Steroidobacter sp.]|uniref:aldehyde dehydrogenase family protein n=1 Tax=Steroidobacter sp. TaxID=1978227 RepID=UPI002ED9B28A
MTSHAGVDPATVSWRSLAQAADIETRLFVDGAFVEAAATERLPSVNPATGRVLAHFSNGCDADADRAVLSAQAAFRSGSWSDLSPVARQAVLLQLAGLIERDAVNLALLDSLQMGKPVRQALADAYWAARFFRYYAEAADKVAGAALPTDRWSLAFSRRAPQGVVTAIVPWNFPVVNAAIKLAPALVAGNAVVLKPSEIASASALRLARLAYEAGLPKGVLNVVTGAGERIGAALARHPGVQMITFTGSTRTGLRLMELVGQSGLRPLMLECGGKSAHIVFGDIEDLDTVADRVAADIFRNQGQVCSAGSRLLVHSSLARKLTDLIIERARAIRPADPLLPETSFGPLAAAAQFERVMNYIQCGRDEGAVVAFGGRACMEDSGGYFIEPTILTNVDSRMRVAREEIFGPVLAILSFENEQEAVRIANGTEYGLSATVWTNDMQRGQRVSHALVSGVVTVLGDSPAGSGGGMALASEPWRQSGFGVQGGVEGLYPFMRMKAVQFLFPRAGCGERVDA